jgi:hypothetical protein
MHKPKLIYLCVAILATGGLAAVATSGLASAPAAAGSGSVGTPFVTYKAPSGPQLSGSAAADIAVREARAFGDPGEVKIALARGTLMQARTVMEHGSVASAKARETELASRQPAATFCFGGQNAACTEAEQAHAKEALAAEAATPTYLLAMSGSGFTPPERLPRGGQPITGSSVLLLIDAHTGIRVGLTIGAGTAMPKLSELQGYETYVAAAQSNSAQAAGTKPSHDRPRPTIQKPVHSHPRPSFGTVRGTFSANREVVVFRSRAVFARTRVRHGAFRTLVHEGSYSIAGRRASGGYCPAKRIVVRSRHTTVVHLGC